MEKPFWKNHESERRIVLIELDVEDYTDSQYSELSAAIGHALIELGGIKVAKIVHAADWPAALAIVEGKG